MTALSLVLAGWLLRSAFHTSATPSTPAIDTGSSLLLIACGLGVLWWGLQGL